MVYQANATRYQTMEYRRCGHSGLKLPAISLGFGTILATKRGWKPAVSFCVTHLISA
jgi:hypothetical protein